MKTAILILVCCIVANAQPTASNVCKVLQPSNDVPIPSAIRDRLPRAADIRVFLVLQNGDTAVVYDTVRDKDDADFMDNQPRIAFVRKGAVVFDTDSTASSGPVRFHGMATMPDSSGNVAAAFAFTLGVDGAETFFVFIGQEGRNYKVTGTLKGAQSQLRFGNHQLGQLEFWTANGQVSKNPDEQCVWCRQYYKVTTYLLRPEGIQRLRTSESKQSYSPETFSETPFKVVQSAHPNS
jgi:hypothetical protein